MISELFLKASLALVIGLSGLESVQSSTQLRFVTENKEDGPISRSVLSLEMWDSKGTVVQSTGKRFSAVNQKKQSHVSTTALRFLSRGIKIFSAFSGLTPTSSKAARKCLRNKSK